MGGGVACAWIARSYCRVELLVTVQTCLDLGLQPAYGPEMQWPLTKLLDRERLVTQIQR